MTAAIAPGWSGCRAGPAPVGEALPAAHASNGHFT